MTYVFMQDGEQKDFTVQVVSGSSKVVSSAVTLESIIEDTKKQVYAEQVKAFRCAVETSQNPKAVKKEDYIPSFLPHGLVANRVKLKDLVTGEFRHDRWLSTELVHMDLDHIPQNKMHTVIKKIDTLCPLARFKSPSGKGLKVFWQHDCGELTYEQRLNFRNALRRVIRGALVELGLGEYYDFSPTNANRQCYFSTDANAKYNTKHKMFPLSVGYSELKALQQRSEEIKQELAGLVVSVQNNVSATALDKHIEKTITAKINKCSGNGNTQSYALCCELVRCGLSDADILTHVSRFKMLCNGDWNPSEKVRAARADVGTERNGYASDTVEVDAGIDTERYTQLMKEQRDIKCDIDATTTNTDITNQLALGLINQRLQLTHQLVRDEGEYYEQAKAIHSAVQVSKVVTVVENAGSGKSRTMGELAKLIDADIQAGDVTWKGMVFATNTRANRDAFAKANNFTVVKGVTEIIFDVTKSAAAEIRAAEIYSEDFELDEKDKRSVVDALLAESYITQQQANTIRTEARKNSEKLKGPFLAICHAKMRCGGLVARFMRHVVVMDEMAADDVVALCDADETTVYGTKVKLQDKELKAEDEVRYFMEQIAERKDTNGNSVGGVVMLSAEKSLLRAFGTDDQPNIRLKGMFGNITVKHLGKPRTLVDNNLSVVVVDSLTNNFETKKSAETARDKMARLLQAEGYFVICDGKREDTSCIGNTTIEGCKGSNEMMTTKTAVLISCPHPFEVGQMAMRLGCDEATAVSVIVSDKANQAIGRNVGYRNRGEECLLVVAAGVHSADKTLTLDVISNNCFYARKRTDVDTLPVKLQGIFSEWLNDDDAVCYKVAMDLYTNIFVHDEVTAKDLKEVVRVMLAENGAAKTRITRGGLVNTTISQLGSLGVTAKVRQKCTNGVVKSTTYYGL